jgi:hypothetical protein
VRNSNRGRFVVWDLDSDPYENEQLALNWDRLDNLIGGPSGVGSGQPGDHDTSTPPKPLGTPSSWLNLGDVNNDPENRTLYSVIAGLDFNDAPLGSIIMWWRPGPSVLLPAGWVPCDGSTYTNNTAVSPPIKLHSYAQAAITVPDFRNAFPIGAYETNKQTYSSLGSSSPLNRDGLAPDATDDPTTGPGIGYASSSSGTAKNLGRGSNVPRNLHHYHDAGTYHMADHRHSHPHTHDMSNHTHRHEHVHWTGNHQHLVPTHSHGLANHVHSIDHYHLLGHHEHVIDWSINDGRHFELLVPVFFSDADVTRVSGGPRLPGFFPLNDSTTTFAVNSDGVFDTANGPRSHSMSETGFGPNSGGPNVNQSDPQGGFPTGFPTNVDGGSTIYTGIAEVPPGGTSFSPSTDGPSINQTTDGSNTDHVSGNRTNFQDVNTILGQSGSTPQIPGGDATAVDLSQVDIRPNFVSVLFIQKILHVDNIV